MSQTILTSSIHTSPSSSEPTAPRLVEDPTIAYLELSRREAFGLAYALVGHCRRMGTPSTELQHSIMGLRDFLLHRLDEEKVQTLLRSI